MILGAWWGCTEPTQPQPQSQTASGGQIGEQSTQEDHLDPSEALLWVPGPAAASGGGIESLVASELSPVQGERSLGAHFASFGDTIAVTSEVSGQPLVWVLPTWTLTGNGNTTQALEVLETGALSGLFSMGGLLGALSLEADRITVFDEGELWAAWEGHRLGRPLATGEGWQVPHGEPGAMWLAEVPLDGGSHDVQGGVPLPDGARSVSLLGDLDGDAIPELWAQGEGRGWVLSRTGAVLASLEDVDQLLELGDLDGDGRSESVLCRQRGEELELGLVLGLEPQPERWTVQARGPVQSGDLDGDGLSELLASAVDGWWVLSAPTQQSSWIEGMPDTSFAHLVEDLDGDGTSDLVVGAIR